MRMYLFLLGWYTRRHPRRVSEKAFLQEFLTIYPNRILGVSNRLNVHVANIHFLGPGGGSGWGGGGGLELGWSSLEGFSATGHEKKKG